MAIIGNCIKTGAVVKFTEYGQTFAADLFKVANAVIIRFAPNAFDDPMAFNHPRAVTHEVYIGSSGLLDKRNGYAVADCAHVSKV
jgi:hypothetical protein